MRFRIDNHRCQGSRSNVVNSVCLARCPSRSYGPQIRRLQRWRTWRYVLIGDSIPWKEDLLRIAESLERRTRQRRWVERTSFLVERDVMNAAYAVRKLNEARGQVPLSGVRS